MPATASLAMLPVFVLMFIDERHGPNKAMQILDPQSLINFSKANILEVKEYIEGSLSKWLTKSASWNQGLRDTVHAEMLKTSFCAYFFIGHK